MREIYFKGSKIFEFEDNNAIQIIGNNTYLISLILDIYAKIFSGYKFTDTDIEAMNGYYPEIIEDGKSLKKKDMLVIRLSNITDIIEQLSTKKSSILMKNVLDLNNDLIISELIGKLEEVLIGLSIGIDRLLESKLDLKEVFIKSDIDNVNFDKIVNTFINLNFTRENEDKIPLWLLNESESIDMLISLIKLLIESREEITIIVDKLDSKISIEYYTKLIDDLYQLTIGYSNFRIWIIPSIKEGVFLNYNIFENTYIIGEEIIKLGSFDITYESICRNYPDNNIPSKYDILVFLLQNLAFHKSQNMYFPTKEAIIVSIFLKLLGEDSNIQFTKQELSNLERNFLTSLI